jgi:hypothetical protein
MMAFKENEFPIFLFSLLISGPGSAIRILATDEHGETRNNTEEFNKLTVK